MRRWKQRTTHKMAIYPFLTFNGNCREAMIFYQWCFGGELEISCLGDAPEGRGFPAEMQQLVVHAALRSEHIQLFASDMAGEDGLRRGNMISLYCQAAPDEVFARLAEQGKVTDRSAPWATLTDKYGVMWIFS